MPDFTIEIMQQCNQLSQHAREINGHKLYFHAQFGGWECDCKGYKFRKTCKHVKQAEAEQCTWHQNYGIAQTEQQAADRECPECGGFTNCVRVAV